MVDVLDVDGALLDARAAVRAGPQHVGIDDAALFQGADQRPEILLGTRTGDTAEAGFRDVVPLFVRGLQVQALECTRLLAEDVGRLGHQVIAQVHDDELGRQRLSGVPRRALRLAAAALGARGEVEVALPGEVLDLAAAEHRVLGGILEVDGLALVLHRQQRAQAIRAGA